MPALLWAVGGLLGRLTKTDSACASQEPLGRPCPPATLLWGTRSFPAVPAPLVGFDGCCQRRL